MYYKSIAIKNLLVSDENYRFDPQQDEVDAIEMTLYELGDKQVNLAKDILEIGLAPHESIIVIAEPDKPGKFRVLEGNRRVSAIKLLIKPKIIRDPHLKKIYYQRFERLAKNGIPSSITTFRCCVVDSIQEANPWIQKKHTPGQTGTGVEPWAAESAERYNIRNKVQRPSLGYLIIADLRRRKVFDPPHGFSYTTFNRIMQTAYAQQVIGVTKNDNDELVFILSEEQAIDRLILLISNFPHARGGEGITSRLVNKKEEIETLIDSLFNKGYQENGRTGTNDTDSPPNDTDANGNNGDDGADTDDTSDDPDGSQDDEQNGDGSDGNQGNNGTNTGTDDDPNKSNGKKKTPPRETEFFEDFDLSLIDPTKDDQTALFNVVNELILLSKSYCKPFQKKTTMECYWAFPNATASLLRTVLELSLKLFLKRKNLWNEAVQSVYRKGAAGKTYIMLADLKKFIATKSQDDLFTEPSAKAAYNLIVDGPYVDILNGIVHHPGTTKSNGELLKAIAKSGLITLIVSILKEP